MGGRQAQAQRVVRAVGPLVICVWVVGAMMSIFVADRRLVALGREDLRDGTALIYLVAIVSASAVGTVLVRHHPANPAGWCFGALGISMALSGVLDSYALVGAVADPGALSFASAVAVVGDASFIPWLVLVSLALHLTPTGRPLSRRWGWAAAGTVLSGLVWWVVKCLSVSPLDPPYADVVNPMAVAAWSGPVEAVRGVSGALTGLGVLLAGLSLIVRFLRAEGIERRQLHWLALAVIPLPLFVGLSFLGAATQRPLLVVVSTSGFVALIPIAAGLAIGRYHLYGVDRLLSRAATYTLLTAAVLVLYLGGVVVIDRALRGLTTSDRSTASALVAALAVAAATPLRGRLQDAVDRRFSRRRYAALAVVRAHTQDRAPGTALESVVQRAVGDASLRIDYWVAPRGCWVTAEGLDPPSDGRATVVLVVRHGQPIARISFDDQVCDSELVRAVAAEGLTLLENTGLRAALELELVEVQASRSRIAQAQLEERRRIERDLHDGAQQRLLALAMQLQAALVNGDRERLKEAAEIGVGEARATVRELRDLANGLHSDTLTEGGLAAALDALVIRVPGAVDLHVGEQRYSPAIEGTAWFIVCEALTNAMKHAPGASVQVSIDREGDFLVVEVNDDGPGVADPEGSGLRGLADRAAASGGRATVLSDTTGTRVRAELPCVS
jgi:signal transduction histidine kinase